MLDLIERIPPQIATGSTIASGTVGGVVWLEGVNTWVGFATLVVAFLTGCVGLAYWILKTIHQWRENDKAKGGKR